MARNVAKSSYVASAFAAAVCAFAVAMVVLGLSTSPRPQAGVDTPAVLTAAH
jgi:hypothetical protein